MADLSDTDLPVPLSDADLLTMSEPAVWPLSSGQTRKLLAEVRRLRTENETLRAECDSLIAENRYLQRAVGSKSRIGHAAADAWQARAEDLEARVVALTEAAREVVDANWPKTLAKAVRRLREVLEGEG